MNLFSKDDWAWALPRAPECRMYRRSVLPLSAYLLLVVVYLVWGRHLASAWWRAAFALAPMLAYLRTFVIYFDYLRECDELERKIELEAIAIAAMLCIFTAMSGLMLLSAKVLPSGIQALDVLLATMLVLAFGYLVVRYWLLWRASR